MEFVSVCVYVCEHDIKRSNYTPLFSYSTTNKVSPYRNISKTIPYMVQIVGLGIMDFLSGIQ